MRTWKRLLVLLCIFCATGQLFPSLALDGARSVRALSYDEEDELDDEEEEYVDSYNLYMNARASGVALLQPTNDVKYLLCLEPFDAAYRGGYSALFLEEELEEIRKEGLAAQAFLYDAETEYGAKIVNVDREERDEYLRKLRDAQFTYANNLVHRYAYAPLLRVFFREEAIEVAKLYVILESFERRIFEARRYGDLDETRYAALESLISKFLDEVQDFMEQGAWAKAKTRAKENIYLFDAQLIRDDIGNYVEAMPPTLFLRRTLDRSYFEKIAQPYGLRWSVSPGENPLLTLEEKGGKMTLKRMATSYIYREPVRVVANTVDFSGRWLNPEYVVEVTVGYNWWEWVLVVFAFGWFYL